MNNEIVVEGNFARQTLAWLGHKLVVLDGEVIVLDEGLAFEIENSHRYPPSLDLEPYIFNACA